jgi:predicted DNA binding CopG/RHH family protein
LKSKAENKKKILVFRAEDRLIEQFKEIADNQGYGYCELLRVILRKYVEEKGYQIK